MSDSKKTPKKAAAAAEDKSKDAGGKDSQEAKDAKAAAGTAGTAIVDLGFLEADDDFEEFPAEEWSKVKGPGEAVGAGVEEEDEPVNIWEDNWDDDNIEEDFSLQLK